MSAAIAAAEPPRDLGGRLDLIAEGWLRDAALYTGRRREWRVKRAERLRERAREVRS